MIRRRYGASPLHLLGHLAALAIVAYALGHVFGTRFAPQPLNLALWLLAGALLHDLVLLPAYVLADILARVAAGERRIPVANHIRVPAVMAGTLLLVYLPLILQRQPANFVNATGHPPPDEGRRWLLITAGLFAASGLVYGLRVTASALAARRRRSP